MHYVYGACAPQGNLDPKKSIHKCVRGACEAPCGTGEAGLSHWARTGATGSPVPPAELKARGGM